MESWTRCLGPLILLKFQRKLCMLFSVSFLIYFRIVYIWPMYHSFHERIYFTDYFSLSKRVTFCSKFDFLDPCRTEGPVVQRASVCPSTVWYFYQEWVVSFFRFFAPWYVIGIFKNWQSPFFQENSFFPKFGQNLPQMIKKCFWGVFWKILSLVFLGNNLKVVLLLIFHHQSHIWQNSGSWVMGWTAGFFKM